MSTYVVQYINGSYTGLIISNNYHLYSILRTLHLSNCLFCVLLSYNYIHSKEYIGGNQFVQSVPARV